MILIIYDPIDISTSVFINLLHKKKIDFLAIRITELDKLSVYDDGVTCLWHFNDIRIDFHNLSGIYLRSIDFLNKELFLDIRLEDRNYAKRELRSYLIYRLNKYQNCLNPISMDIVSQRIFFVPFFLKIALENGFIIPYYYFSNQYTELNKIFHEGGKQFITHHSFFANTKFIPAKYIGESTIGLLEVIDGIRSIMHIIDDKIFCTEFSNHRRIKKIIKQEERNKVLTLIKNLSLRSAQIIFIQNENNKVLYNISPYPNFCLASTDQQEEIFEHLLQKLTL